MRMSCNGCRVLRKGCSDDCSIRPCLQWIKSPESQANATIFLAKFYGRAGLMNLINAGPEHLRPAIFRSLLYEACGRIVNPIYGSVGLLWSGNFQLCQSAVGSVLNGTPITPITSETAADSQGPPLKVYDIRRVSKDENSAENRVGSRSGVKRSAAEEKAEADLGQQLSESNVSDSSVSASIVSVETSDEAYDNSNKPCCEPVVEEEIKLDLTLGVSRDQHVVPVKKRKYEAFVTSSSAADDDEKVELGLDCLSWGSVRKRNC